MLFYFYPNVYIFIYYIQLILENYLITKKEIIIRPNLITHHRVIYARSLPWKAIPIPLPISHSPPPPFSALLNLLVFLLVPFDPSGGEAEYAIGGAMASAGEFAASVEDGLKLAKRIGAPPPHQAPPRHAAGMERSTGSATMLPAAPMAYAVVADPASVDNPDVPSYQPHVYGRCDPPALIPLQLKEIALEVECLLGEAFVVARGRWWVHCIMRNRSCDCRLAVPMGEQVSTKCVLFLVSFDNLVVFNYLIVREVHGEPLNLLNLAGFLVSHDDY